MKKSRLLLGTMASGFLMTLAPFASQAALDFPTSQASVLVICGNRQGSGTVINGTKGYVLTNAHVAVNVDTMDAPSSCRVGFLTESGEEPRSFYRAQIDKWSFDGTRNRDFAVLKINEHINGPLMSQPFPEAKTNEFSQLNDDVTIAGYSGKEDNKIVVREGKIIGYEKGFIQVDAEVSNGDSGGSALDQHNALIGAPTRIVTYFSSGETERVSYEIVDVRAVMNWLDTYEPNLHDQYFTHTDFNRYHQQAVFVGQEKLGCEFVVRTQFDPAVNCILPNEERWIFPNAETYLSWFPSFTNVTMVGIDTVAPFQIKRNATFKPGTLVKSKTNPKVYVVVDTFGTLRWVPSESRAQQIWGQNWSGLVHDIPDEFFSNYTIGQALDL